MTHWCIYFQSQCAPATHFSGGTSYWEHYLNSETHITFTGFSHLWQLAIVMLELFRSWCHNLNVCVSTHLYCYQRCHFHSTHCSNSHSTLTASCHTSLTCCSLAESLKTSVKRETCLIMLYQLVSCSVRKTYAEVFGNKVLRPIFAFKRDNEKWEWRKLHV